MYISLVTQNEKAGAQDLAYALTKYLNEQHGGSKLCFLYKKRHGGYSSKKITDVLDFEPERLIEKLQAVIGAFVFLRRHRGAVLICHTQYSLIIGGLLGKLAGMHKVVWVHHSVISTKTILFRWANLLLGSTSLVDRIICVSDVVREEHNRYPSTY